MSAEEKKGRSFDYYIIDEQHFEVAYDKRKTGRWETVEDEGYAGGGYWQCTSCEYRYSFGAYFEADEEFFFCPHCGAKMEIEKYEEED